ncbi:hypothetical protein llap_6746 [Limosa lapponica baueri]|uniref:Uncharacterized protein n=1 Tax=Limosa lapponica baueri TaxID=1758121 RepID=A0A2I0UAD4_LIMLA|nr:hypothetical protein llap_6746 [Limosa lapponica baueri]
METVCFKRDAPILSLEEAMFEYRPALMSPPTFQSLTPWDFSWQFLEKLPQELLSVTQTSEVENKPDSATDKTPIRLQENFLVTRNEHMPEGQDQQPIRTGKAGNGTEQAQSQKHLLA